MNPATLTLAAKSVTLRIGTQAVTASVNPALIQSVIADGTGSKGQLFWGNIPQVFTSTSSPATLLSGLPYIAVTVKGGVSTYIPTSMMRSWYTPASGSGTDINVLTNPAGKEYELLSVTESKATIDAAYAAVAASGGGGGGIGTTANYTAAGTNQGTATATATNGININGGGAGAGVILSAATAGASRKVYNDTSTSKFVYPASGEFINPNAVNEPIELGPGEGIVLNCLLATEWSSDENENSQSVAASGLVQGGGQIRTGAQDVTVTSATGGVNTAVTLPAALPGRRVDVANITAVNVRLYPGTGDAITTLGANNFYTLSATKTAELICEVAGTWIFAQSSVDVISVATIQPQATTQGTSLTDPVLGRNAFFSSTGIVLDRGMTAFQAAGVATPGGVQGDGVQISSNIFNIETCATLGDSATLTGVADFVWVKNSGVATAYVYCPSTGTMDGVTDGFRAIPAGQSAFFYNAINAGGGTWISIPAGESAQSLTGSSTQTQAAGTKVRGSVVTLATISVALDAFTIDPTSGVKEMVVFNNAGVSGSLFPPVGGTIDGGATDAVFVVPRSCAFLLTTTNGLDYKVYLLPGATQVASASTTQTQAGGTAIIGPVNCTVAAVAGDAYSLKNYSPRQLPFINMTANSVQLFPTVGGNINGGAANASFSVEAGAAFWIWSNDGQGWFTRSMASVTLGQTNAYLTAAQVAGTYVVGGGQAFDGATGSLLATDFVYVPALTGGNTNKARLCTATATNATAPGGTITYGLYPVTVAGGAAVVTYTLGAVVAGSNTVVVPDAASTVTASSTGYFTLAAGTYVVGVVTAANIAAGAHVHLSARVEVLS